MHSLSIYFGPSAVMWQFLFREKKDAHEALRRTQMNGVSEPGFEISDDFGQHAYIYYAEIHGSLVEDIELMEEARIQRALADARASAKLQTRARSDATIRQAQQGSPVLQPMGAGPRFNG
jgi:hypothetical protein